jgi:DNA-binding transcriptional LysR family regulator
MDTLKAMRIFVRVVEAGSITAAAGAFELSPTMLGNHLQALESHLGTRLLIRTTRRQALTEFGQSYYNRCLEILALVEDAETMAQVEQATVRGTLRITAPTIWAQAALMPVIGIYLDRHPDVDLDIMATDTQLDFVDNGLEAAIRLGTSADESMQSHRLRPYELVLCAAPSYLARKGVPESPEDLKGHHCLAFGYPPTSQWWTPTPCWRLRKSAGSSELINVPLVPRMKVSNAFALHAAALDGLGIAMLPRMLAAGDLSVGHLQPVLSGHLAPPLSVDLVYRKDRRRSPRLESFIRFISDHFKDQ